MAVKFTAAEKADIANGVEALIKSSQRAANAASDQAVKLAHQAGVKRLQDLFVKVRSDL